MFNPFLTAFALFVILAHAFGSGTVASEKLLFASTFFMSIGPILHLLALRDRQDCRHGHVAPRREAVFTAFVLFYLGGTATLCLLHGAGVITASMRLRREPLVVQLITRYWKISTHALGITRR